MTDEGSMSGMCKDCKHWRQSAKFGECRIAATKRGELKFPGTKAYAADLAPQYRAYLFTAPDFGCNQWEKA